MPPTPEQEQILREEKFGILGTHRRDGGIQLTPINYLYQDDGTILISTTRDRAKYHNVRRDGRVSLCVARPETRPYVTVYGTAVIEDNDIVAGTAALFQRISDRPLPDGFEEGLRQQQRILIVMTPERFVP